MVGVGVHGLATVWHGTSHSVALKIATTGFVNVKFNPNDKGYFGSGIYVSPQPRYAAAYVTGLCSVATLLSSLSAPSASLSFASRSVCCVLGELSKAAAQTDQKEWVIVMGHALVGLAYPVTRDVDYAAGAKQSLLYGAPMDQVYDTRFVVVDPAKAYQAADDASTLPLQELVFKDEAQLLPRYLVYFTSALPVVAPPS